MTCLKIQPLIIKQKTSAQQTNHINATFNYDQQIDKLKTDKLIEIEWKVHLSKPSKVHNALLVKKFNDNGDGSGCGGFRSAGNDSSVLLGLPFLWLCYYFPLLLYFLFACNGMELENLYAFLVMCINDSWRWNLWDNSSGFFIILAVKKQ